MAPSISSAPDFPPIDTVSPFGEMACDAARPFDEFRTELARIDVASYRMFSFPTDRSIVCRSPFLASKNCKEESCRERLFSLFFSFCVDESKRDGYDKLY